MYMRIETVLAAARTLRAWCADVDDCGKCIFRQSNSTCGICDPNTWKLSMSQDTTTSDDACLPKKNPPLTFLTYQHNARRTQSSDLASHQRFDHAMFGLAAEVGEIHGIYQKAMQGHSVQLEHLIEEIGDVLWMLSELCDVTGITMESAAIANTEKLWKRYPSGFDSGRSVHRHE